MRLYKCMQKTQLYIFNNRPEYYYCFFWSISCFKWDAKKQADAWMYTGNGLEDCLGCLQCSIGTQRLSRRWCRGREGSEGCKRERERTTEAHTRSCSSWTDTPYLLSRCIDTGYRTRMVTHDHLVHPLSFRRCSPVCTTVVNILQRNQYELYSNKSSSDQSKCHVVRAFAVDEHMAEESAWKCKCNILQCARILF